jgi:peptide/nickel transport system permease protein
VKYILKKLFYSLLVLLGVVALVFVMFQGFGDPARMIMGQTGDKKTMDNIRKDLYLDQPKWKQFVLGAIISLVSKFHTFAKVTRLKKK